MKEKFNWKGLLLVLLGAFIVSYAFVYIESSYEATKQTCITGEGANFFSCQTTNAYPSFFGEYSLDPIDVLRQSFDMIIFLTVGLTILVFPIKYF